MNPPRPHDQYLVDPQPIEQLDGLPTFDLIEHINRQISFSVRAFGPGPRTKGICDHITKELVEVQAAPKDLSEWIDVIMLGLDGAWRAGYIPEQIAAALADKLTRNARRTWPDWRTSDPDKAIEHDRSKN